MEDNILREKITHFDHERIPERVVHARGSGAHGFFQCYNSLSAITKADLFSDAGKITEVFVRFSTVAGGAGSGDLPRDVRGFATRFYTNEGNWDLVGNDIPVFFIQDAMKFPDLIHSVKMEPDRGFPQASSAHHNFWDFVSLMPESLHTVMWAMSDRGIPRSFRNIEGFGVNTFTMVNASGGENFVKFHWKPLAGLSSVLWDEAVKIQGADPDYHRRDLWQAIEDGNTTGVFPEWELGIQVISHAKAATFDFDILDATKLVPEELVPVQLVGKMTLNRNPYNFFAETEQIALHPGNLPPGIDVSNDPLLQGRLFSYLDTQLIRLGGPNFHEIPINRPLCPYRNFQRDGYMQVYTQAGRINYSPNSAGEPAVSGGDDRQKLFGRFRTESGTTVRARSATFADHYSQPRLFYQSQTSTEQGHIISALIVELSQVDGVAIRERMIGHLLVIDNDLATRVANGIGLDASSITPATPLSTPISYNDTYPSLSILLSSSNGTLLGRHIGCIIGGDVDSSLVSDLRSAITDQNAKVTFLSHQLGDISSSGGNDNSSGSSVTPDGLYSTMPSALFDSVLVLVDNSTANDWLGDSLLQAWISDAYRHLKVIGYIPGAEALLTQAGVQNDNGTIDVSSSDGRDSFLTASMSKVWSREENVYILP